MFDSIEYTGKLMIIPIWPNIYLGLFGQVVSSAHMTSLSRGFTLKFSGKKKTKDDENEVPDVGVYMFPNGDKYGKDNININYIMRYIFCSQSALSIIR